jgi:hypothetical protein
VRAHVLFLLLAWGLACSSLPSQPLPSEPAPAEVPPAAVPAPAPAREVPLELRYRRGADGPEFSTWSPGDALFLGVDLANLRDSPSSEAPVVATLPMGAPMEVLEASSEPVTVLERTNRWYRVRSGKSEGHVFGSLLTPLALQADLDGDGGKEWLSLTFGPDFAPRVRVMEPGLREDEDRMVGLDLKMPGLAQGGTARVEVRVPQADPWNLLQVQLCEGGRCVARLVSYLREPGKELGQLFELPGDPATLTFVPGGVTLGRQTLWRQGAVFGALPFEGATLLRSDPELVQSLTLESVERGPDTDVSCWALGKLGDGEHRGKTLIGCPIRQGGKGGPDNRYPHRFVRASPERWIFLPRLSYEQGWGQDLLFPALQAEGIAVEQDPALTVTGLEAPQAILQSPWGQLERAHYADQTWAPSGAEVLSVDPSHGALYGFREEDGALYLPQPEGNYVVYNYALGDWTERYAVRSSHCGDGSDLYAELADYPLSELKLHATSPAGQELYVHPERPGKALLWKDPFGRLVELLHPEAQPPDLCEPVLYLYGTDEPVTITLDPDIFVTVSAPRIQDQRWTVLPTGDGGVRVGERTWPFLFWEGQHGLFEPPAEGVGVARGEVRAFLRRVLPAHGLQGREIEDFVSAWADKLEQSPFVRISFHERADIDELVPMTIEPEPDTLIRVLMEYEPLDSAPASRWSPPPAVPPRRGFTVVEWGGVVR